MLSFGEIDSILQSCSADILGFEDGDLLLVSRIIDDLERLAPFFDSLPGCAGVLADVNGLLRRLVGGAPYAAIERLAAAGFDLLIRLAAARRDEGETLPDAEGFSRRIEPAIAEFRKALGATPSGAPLPAPWETAGEPFEVFLAEAGGNIVRAQDIILELERHPDDHRPVNELFRIFHTIKGECGFLKIDTIGEVSHTLENLLDLLRNRRLPVDTPLTDILLDGIDAVTSLLEKLAHHDRSALDPAVVRGTVARVTSFIQKNTANIGELLRQEGKLTDDELRMVLEKQRASHFERKFGEIAVGEKLVSAEELEATLKAQTAVRTDRAEAVIQVNASQVHELVDMVGELLIIEALLEGAGPHLARLHKTTRAIQRAAMQLRTEKVERLFLTMKRAVRDAARALGKRVTTDLRGADLEIDRDLVERLHEPLLHLVRNAVGHGIENEKERLGSGKAPEGRILLEAERRGNTIVIAVEDDGRGLDRGKIIATAVAQKLVTPDEVARLSDDDVYDFIFREGFSTAETVDRLSGRGVGMDIVKNAAAAARGRIAIRTEPGRRMRTELVFPLSTAIIDGMIVKCAGAFCVIPAAQVVESMRTDGRITHRVSGSEEILVLRGEMVPVIRLAEYFGRPDDRAGGSVAVVVGSAAAGKYALLVDEVVAKREVFIKSLGAGFRRLRGIVSGTILPGGAIGFVLDVDGIVRDAAGRGVQTAGRWAAC